MRAPVLAALALALSGAGLASAEVCQGGLCVKGQVPAKCSDVVVIVGDDQCNSTTGDACPGHVRVIVGSDNCQAGPGGDACKGGVSVFVLSDDNCVAGDG